MAIEWRTVRLGDVIELKRGFDLPSQNRRDGPYPIVSSSGISGRHIEAKAEAPGVVIGRYGTLGQVHYITEDYWPLNTSLYVRDFKGNDPKFVSYFLRSLDFGAYSDKAAVPGLNRNDLHTEVVCIPPVAEQRRIAGILGALDDKIELNRRMSQTLESIARALFKSWFVDFDPVHAKSEGRGTVLPNHLAMLFPDHLVPSQLGPAPAGWHVATLGEMTRRPQYGFTASASGDPIGPKFLRITDINKSPWIDWATVPYCAVTASELRQYGVKTGDILVARIADPGHGVLIEEDVQCVFASYLIRFRPLDDSYARYLQYWLRSDGYWDLVQGRRTGTTRAGLNAQVLSDFPILDPSPAVAAAFGRAVTELRATIGQNVSEITTMGSLRDGLLPKLMSPEPGVLARATQGTPWP